MLEPKAPKLTLFTQLCGCHVLAWMLGVYKDRRQPALNTFVAMSVGRAGRAPEDGETCARHRLMWEQRGT